MDSTSSHRGNLGDTLIVSAREATYAEVFLAEQCWYPVRLDERRRSEIRWIAAYRGRPLSAITSYAQIERIEPYLETGRYRIVFSKPVDLPRPVELRDRSKGAIQGHRYTMLERLKAARTLTDLEPWD